jgi:hypothetical protein
MSYVIAHIDESEERQASEWNIHALQEGSPDRRVDGDYREWLTNNVATI